MSQQSAITHPGGTSIVYGTYGGPLATPEQQAVRLPCLPGCDDNHHAAVSECHAAHEIGTLPLSYGTPELTVHAHSRTEGALRFAEVGLSFAGDHPDRDRFLNPDVARRLAVILLDAADTAERVAAGIQPARSHMSLIQ